MASPAQSQEYLEIQRPKSASPIVEDEIWDTVDVFRIAQGASQPRIIDNASSKFTAGVAGNAVMTDDPIKGGEGEAPKTPRIATSVAYDLESMMLALVNNRREELIKSGKMDDMNIAVAACREEIAHTPKGSEDYLAAINSLAAALSTRFNETCELSDLDETISLHKQVLRLLPSSHPSRLASLNNLATAYWDRFWEADQITDLDEAISIRREALELYLPSNPLRYTSLNALAEEVYTRFQESRTNIDLNEAISLYKQALENQSSQKPDRSTTLNDLGRALWERFDRDHEKIDLDEAVSFHRQALELRPSPHTKRHISLHNLASVLSTRYDLGLNQSDLDEAILLHREAVQLLDPLDPTRGTVFNNLASALLTRFKNSGKRVDVDESVDMHRKALELRASGHRLRPNSLGSLGSALETRFQHTGQQEDIDEAISLHKEVLELQLPPHPDRSKSLNHLAVCLTARFEMTGQQVDLDQAISLHRQALELQGSIHPNRTKSLHFLGTALCTRFAQVGQQEDLNESLSLHRQVLQLLHPSDPLLPTALLNFAYALFVRFDQQGLETDIEEAISFQRKALELRPSGHPRQSTSLNNLATTLYIRFTQRGQQVDLDDSISTLRETLERLPFPHPKRSNSLSNLATVLLMRFRQAGRQVDLDEAISLYKQSLELESIFHANRSSILTHLASALLTRFEQASRRTDLDDAISFHREALKLQPPTHSERPSYLNNLASALMARFTEDDQTTDIDEAISLLREALQNVSASHPVRSTFLNNLAYALWNRFDEKDPSQRADPEEAISLHKQALKLRIPPHPARSASFFSLGNLLVNLHSLSGKQSEYLEDGISALRDATQYLYQSPSLSLRFSKTWIRHAERYHHSSAIEAYQAALQALPKVVALSLDIQSRHEALINGSDGLARNASICAIRDEDLDRAIEFLEAGRSIFWSQVLSLRSPFDKIRDAAPKLADKLQDIALALELGSYRDTSVELSDNPKKLAIDQEGARLNRLNEEWTEGIEEVRKIKGFEDFLRSPPLSSLRRAASKHPVIMLIANDDISHCLIMSSAKIHHISLPNLHTRMLKKLVRLVQEAVSSSPISRSLVEQTRENIIKFMEDDMGARMPKRMRSDRLDSSNDVFKYVLRMLWDEVVKPIVDILDIKKSKSGEMTVLRWCPTGLFTFLPIHAAGCYDENTGTECASDYFISSYTPTIGVLLTHNPVPATSIHKFKMMAVIQSSELLAAKEEFECIQRHVSTDALVALGVSDKAADVETVASGLSAASIVHFVCHGTQDREKPLDSGLKLHDDLLRVSRIMKEPIKHGSLAFLCACETAMGDETLPDEAISLGASLLFSGFRRVVATMWEMMDKDGPTITDAFYEELFLGPDGNPTPEPDITKSARALHVAVTKLKLLPSKPSFRRWVPFIHMGE